MKRYKVILLLTASALLMQFCSEKSLVPDEPDVIQEDSEADMPVRLSFNLRGERGRAKTKASVVGGVEDTTDYVKNLTMLCFTREGIYLGYREATLENSEGYFTDGHSECFGRELFTGSVPAHTARIHFIANASSHKPGYDLTGNMETVLMRSAKLACDTSEKTIAYWGFHAENNAADLRNWLSVMEITELPNGDKDTSYVKKDGSMVHLIRDRARVQFGAMNDTPELTGNQYRILQIDWIISNGLTKGFLAPYNPNNSSDHYAGYINESTLAIDDGRLSPYTLSDAARFTVTDESQMMNVYRWDRENSAHVFNNLAARMYLFEDYNSADDPPKIILRVKYQKHAGSTAESDQVTKYHTLMLLDSDNQPLTLLRNHVFILNITSMPWEGMGHRTFMEAVDSDEYENNRTVTINDKVDDITDGKYELRILDGGTSKMYQSGTGVQQTINFEFLATDASASIASTTASDFLAFWESTPDASFAANDVTVASYNSTTGRGTVTFTLGTSINSTLQSGVIDLMHKETGLSRKIHIYTIDQFSFLPEGATALTLEATGESRTVNSTTCPTYKMSFRLPGNCPSGLLPVKVRMASITLSPFKYEVSGSEGTDIGVEMAGTENGNTLDDEVLGGMTFVTTANKWNTRPAGSPWNYWYFFNIVSKPMISDGSGYLVEDNSAKIYTVYFDDIRPLRAPANRADGVGLFLKIKYFGDAVGVYTE